MADVTTELEIDEELAALADLHEHMRDLAQTERNAAQERRDTSLEIEEKTRRIAILRGDRVGGRPRRAFGRRSFCYTVAEMLAADSTRMWTATELATKLHVGRHKVSCTLSVLIGSGRAKRVKRGVYRAGDSGPSGGIVKAEPEKTRTAVLAALEAAPDRVWRTSDLVEELNRPDVHVLEALRALVCEGKARKLRCGIWTSRDSTATARPARRRSANDPGFRNFGATAADRKKTNFGPE